MPSMLDYILQHKLDALSWQINKWFAEAGTEPMKIGQATDKAVGLLKLINNDIAREKYIEKIAKEQKINRKVLAGKVELERGEQEGDQDEEDDFSKLPAWAKGKVDEAMKYGFIERVAEHYTGYWFLTGSDHLIQRTNFVVEPLYHIYSQEAMNNRRLLSVNNGFTNSVVEVNSKNVLSLDAFCSTLYSEGHYLPKDGFGRDQLLKVIGKISQHFKTAYELDQLGWQAEEGFFAFANTTYRPPDNIDEQGTLIEYNEWGVVTVNDRHYLSPSKSRANDKVRTNQNIYQNDIYLSYKPSRLTFSEWAQLMVDVYDTNAWMAIPFVIATAFRDMIMHVTKIPHLYAYGPVNAGKSEFGESVSNLFFSGKNASGDLYKPMNLNQGTDFAFWNRMERFFNCPNALNEFDENAIEDNWFRGIKSAYDGEGRTKGAKDRNRAKTQEVNCTLMLMGQYLGTRDDNSVLTRSIPLAFKPVDPADRPEKQRKDFSRLKEAERNGLSGILLEIMNLRPVFKKLFSDCFDMLYKLMAEELKAEGSQVPTRILKNICCMAAVVELAGQHLQLPFKKADFYNYCKKFVASMANLVSSTSGVSEFWGTVEYLLDRSLIRDGNEFMVETTGSITVTKDDKTSEVKTLTPDKTVLFLRVGSVHKQYMNVHRQNTGKQAINEQTLLLYMKDQPYFLGKIKSKRFKDMVTSCYAFDYDLLNINLIRQRDSEMPQLVIVNGMISGITPTAIPGTYQFYLTALEKRNLQDTTITDEVPYKCHVADINAPAHIINGHKVQVKGYLTCKEGSGNTYRTIQVVDYEAVNAFNHFTRALDTAKNTDTPFDTPF